MKICPQCNNQHNKRRIHCSRSCGSKTAAFKISQQPDVRMRNAASNKNRWTEELRREKSQTMLAVVKKYPDSYSAENVSGRAKLREIQSPHGKTKVKGSWEYKVAEWLNENALNWTNKIEPIPYEWNGKKHLYFPDFLVNGILIEVKGYETTKDHAKWSAVTSRLIILKKRDMENLDIALCELLQ